MASASGTGFDVKQAAAAAGMQQRAIRRISRAARLTARSVSVACVICAGGGDSKTVLDPFDTIVIGAGVMGSATAYHLARRNRRVLLLEQFGFLHSRGSSHGKSRIIRLTYPEPQFERLMPHAYRLWAEAERDSGRRVFTQTGGLDFARPENDDFKGRWSDRPIDGWIEGCDPPAPSY